MGAPAGYSQMVGIDYNGGSAPSWLPNGGSGYKAVLNQPDAWQNGDQFQNYLDTSGAVLSPDKTTWYMPTDKFVQPAIKQESDFSALGPLGDALNFGMNFTPIAPFVNTVEGLGSGNIGQAISGVMGLSGTGNAIGKAVSSELTDIGVPTSMLPYATKGVMGAGSTLLSGGSPTQALVNGLASGSGSYAGSQMQGALSGLPDFVVNGLSQATAGALGSAIKGGDIGQGALLSGLNGLGQGFGISGIGTGIQSFLNNQQQQQKLTAQSSARAKLAARLAALRG